LTIGEIAALTGARPGPGVPLDRVISNVAPLDTATSRDLAFFENPKYLHQLALTRAGACLMAPRFADRAPSHIAVLPVSDAYRAFVGIARTLFPGSLRPSSLFGAADVAVGASVHPSARLESGSVIDPGVVVGPGAEIGAGTILAANAVVGPGVRIGRNCSIGAHSSILHALVGDRVIIHPGCRIGQDGFGFVMGRSGHLKVPQIGRVIVQDDVEIGAGSTIDRGANRDTVVGEGTKIDNLVQIGHNVKVGKHCLLVSQVGIAGSTELGDYVAVAGQSGFSGHLKIGHRVQVAAKSAVLADVPDDTKVMGSPAVPFTEFARRHAALKKLARKKAL
jgi:UDP-3-O-[3-hydroxymyristoyl] glucosamine N-acyltransferase